jgi:hypothetical protein
MLRSWLRKIKILGVVTVLALGVTACDSGDVPIFMKKWLGWYPVQITINLEADGKPLKISRTFECTQYICTSTRCFGALEWRSSRGVVVEKLPSGGVVIFRPYRVCKEGNIDPVKSNGRVHKVLWVDNLKSPTKVQDYNVGAIFSTTIPDDEQRISVRNMNLKYSRVEWNDAKIDTSVNLSDAYWLHDRVRTLERGSLKPRKLAELNGIGYPERLWSKVPELQLKLGSANKPQHVQMTKKSLLHLEALWKNLRSKFNKERPRGEMVPSSFGSSPWHVSFEYLGKILWRLRSTSSEYATQYLAGRMRQPINQEIIIGKEKLSVSPGVFVYDPSTRMLIKMGSRHF